MYVYISTNLNIIYIYTQIYNIEICLEKVAQGDANTALALNLHRQ